MQKTFSAKEADITRKWWVIDAADRVLGEVAVEAARLLRGKHKPVFTSHIDSGDYVVVINAEKVRLTGKKETRKIYHSFSGYVGGHHARSVRTVRESHPERLVERAVRGMIPHNPLGSRIIKKLKVYSGAGHPHKAHNPEVVKIS